MRSLIYSIFILILALQACSPQKKKADLLIKGGNIYTMNETMPSAVVVAVQGNKIVYVGPADGAEKYEAASVIDLEGRTMIPGFIEGHAHLMDLGYNEMELDLMAVRSYEELVERVRTAAMNAKPGDWIIGRGWHQDKWDKMPSRRVKGFQTHHLLSDVSPDNPVFLQHASGHLALVNARAMEIAGVNPLSVETLQKKFDGEGGEIIRDDLGNPTGIFNERAMQLIESHIPPRTAASDSTAMTLAMASCLRHGITSFHDAGATKDHIEIYERFKKNGALQVRLYVMLGGPALGREWFGKGPLIDRDHWLTIRSVKLHCDGALGSRGAWLLQPYSDRPDTHGMATLPMDTVLAISREALQHGFQVCSHAIGDRANREILDRYEMAFEEFPSKAKDHRFRIEHAQHLHPDDIPRFGKLGVIAAMQGIHMSSDRPWAINRLGEKRIEEGAYMWQSLLRSGAKIVNGTDAPVEPLNPIPSFYASVTRKTLEGEPEGGFEPGEKMTREQALRSYTLDAAYGAFQEDVIGSIEEGKLADFTILSEDIMKVEEARLLETRVEMTIVGGEVRFRVSR